MSSELNEKIVQNIVQNINEKNPHEYRSLTVPLLVTQMLNINGVQKRARPFGSTAVLVAKPKLYLKIKQGRVGGLSMWMN